jgi:glycerol-3-phosphate acyltransferase PlsY
LPIICGSPRYSTIMAADIALASLVIAIAYLLGSIPSAYIVVRLMKGADIREAGDGRLGATATFRRAGLAGGAIAGLMDLAKGAAAVLFAQWLEGSILVVLLAAFAAVVGHNWSIFLRFKGGKGALTIYGALASLMFWQILAALALGGIVYLITRKTGMATGILLACLSLIVWFTSSLVPLGSIIPLSDQMLLSDKIVLSILPLFIAIPMAVKHITMPKAGAVTTKSSRGKRG